MKTGIVFEGGANRSVFSCGVMDALLDGGVMPDYIIGISAGAAYGVSYASGQKGRNMEILRRYVNDKRYLGKRNLFKRGNKSIYGLEFVYETVPKELVPFDYDAFGAFKGEFYAGVTNIETGECEYLRVNGKSEKDQSIILEATCALPLLFPVIKYEGVSYLDGGLSNSIPFDKAFEDGVERLLIVLTRPSDYRKGTSSTTKLLAKMYEKKYPNLAQLLLTRAERYNRSLEEISRLEEEGRVMVLRPDYSIGRLETDIKKLEGFYTAGLGRAHENMIRIKEFFGMK